VPQHTQPSGSYSSIPNPSIVARVGDAVQVNGTLRNLPAALGVANQGGQDPQFAIADHLDCHRQVSGDQLPEVHLTSQRTAQVQLAHHPSFVHPPKEVDPTERRAVKQRNGGHLGWDSLVQGHDLELVYNSWEINLMRASGRAGLALGAQPDGVRIQDQVRLPQLQGPQNLVRDQIEVGCERATQRALFALVAQVYILASQFFYRGCQIRG